MVEPGRCATCRWWGTVWDASSGNAGLVAMKPCGLAEAEVLIDHTHPSGERVRSRHKGARLKAVGALHEGATLYTRPDFGCIQWQAREGTDG